MKYDRHYIDGEWCKTDGGEELSVINPATEEEAARIVGGTAAEVDRAVSAAGAAAESWANTPADERKSLLRSIADGLAARADELAKTITTEMGMPSSICRAYQVEPPVMVIDSYLEILDSFSFRRQNKASVSLLEPVGVCALITPWNFPLTQTMLKLAPALAAGCTVVWKPSEVTPLSAAIFAEIVDTAKLPAGVFNMVQGAGADVGTALADHPGVRLVSLTGSTRAGISVAQHAAQTLKRVTLELGGKSPNVICDDADFTKVIPAGVKKCFSNSGQACDAPTRMLVPRARYDEALEIARATAEALVVGHPEDEKTDLGPVANHKQFSRVQELIQRGLDEGARLITGGGGRPEGIARGYYVRPTVFADVDNAMQIAQQEIFGPVLRLLPYSDDDDAIRIANDTPYGLAAYVSSGSARRAAAIAKRLHAGQLRINQAPFDITAPFGGYKMSGYGRELGEAGLEEYLQIKACMGLVE